MESRENVFTQLAKDIKSFSEHCLTREDLYNRVVSYIEMSTEEERLERSKYLKDVEKLHKDTPIINSKLIPYSNWKEGFKLLYNK